MVKIHNRFVIKICTQCGQEKPEEMFSFRKAGKRKEICRKCTNANSLVFKEKNNRRSSVHYYSNRKIYSDRSKEKYTAIKVTPEYDQRQIEKIKERKRLEPIRKARKMECARIRRLARMNEDELFALRVRLAKRILMAFKQRCLRKAEKTTKLLGCSVKTAMEWLEGQFRDGMTWANHGPIWHIDHKTPIAYFDLRKPDQQLKAFHYKNLQPLLKSENIKKSDFLPNGKRARHINKA